ncbi:MAG: cytochrome c [Methylococcaceae bacterium]|nr:cytochrome c [Methylococcaceae bacterium]
MKRSIPILFSLLLLACGSERQNSPSLQDTGKPALHAIQSERLQGLMSRLNDLVFERMLTEVELDRERRLRMQEMAEAAGTMLGTVQEISNALPSLELSSPDRQTFMELSTRLKEQVTALKQEAEQNYVDGIQKRLEQIVAICNECHRSFRQLPR